MKKLLLILGLFPLLLNAQITNLESYLRLEKMMINEAVTNLVNIGWEFGGQENIRKKDDDGNVIEVRTEVSVNNTKVGQELIFINSVDLLKSSIAYSGLELRENTGEDFFINDVGKDLERLGFKKKNNSYERFEDIDAINYKLTVTKKTISGKKSLLIIRKKI